MVVICEDIIFDDNFEVIFLHFDLLNQNIKFFGILIIKKADVIKI